MFCRPTLCGQNGEILLLNLVVRRAAPGRGEVKSVLSNNDLFGYKFIVMVMNSCMFLFILRLTREKMFLLMQGVVINRKVTIAC